MTEPQPPPSMKVPFDLQAGETVLLRARRHWAFLATQMGKLALIALVPVAALLTLAAYTWGLGDTAGWVTWAICGIWLVFWAVRAYFTWYRYNNDLWVVTDQRIVDSTRRHWFHHQIASADLDDVEDMSLRKEGVFAMMFNFGDVQVQTAGNTPKFVLAGIPRTAEVMALVDRQRDAAKRRLRGIRAD